MRVSVDNSVLQEAIICQVRYSLGRMTYVVNDSINFAKNYAQVDTFEIILRDVTNSLEHAVANNITLGMRQDHANWEAFKEWIETTDLEEYVTVRDGLEDVAPS